MKYYPEKKLQTLDSAFFHIEIVNASLLGAPSGNQELLQQGHKGVYWVDL